MFKGKIEFTGVTENDVEFAITEALRSIKEGNITGSGENDSGSYHFEVSNVPRVAYHADESFVDRERPGRFVVAAITEGEPGYMVAGSYATVESAIEEASRRNDEAGLTADDVLEIRLSSVAMGR